MRFKVFDSKLKGFLLEEFYFLDCNGKLHYLNHKEVVSEWIFPVFSTGETDKDDNELFAGDKCEVSHYDSDCTQIVEILPGGIIEGDFGDFGRWTVGFAMGSDYEFKKVGSKYEEQKEVYCHECSKAGGSETGIHHLPPVCKEK